MLKTLLFFLLAAVSIFEATCRVVDVKDDNSLTNEIQKYIDNVSATTDVGLGVGLVGRSQMHNNTPHRIDHNIGLGAGRRSANSSQIQLPGNFTVNSTVVLGSGTKPYVAAAVMRLVDRGVVGFEDKVRGRYGGALLTEILSMRLS